MRKGWKPLKRLRNLVACSCTGLKPGVNEKTFGNLIRHRIVNEDIVLRA
jgi:hypothetical protein